MITEEELASWLWTFNQAIGPWTTAEEIYKKVYRKRAHALLVFLDSKGVVQKDETVLPIPARNDRHLDYVDESWRKACQAEQQNMLKAGFVRVKRLPGVEG
jgi:hypothetical protein